MENKESSSESDDEPDSVKCESGAKGKEVGADEEVDAGESDNEFSVGKGSDEPSHVPGKRLKVDEGGEESEKKKNIVSCFDSISPLINNTSLPSPQPQRVKKPRKSPQKSPPKVSFSTAICSLTTMRKSSRLIKPATRLRGT